MACLLQSAPRQFRTPCGRVVWTRARMAVVSRKRVTRRTRRCCHQGVTTRCQTRSASPVLPLLRRMAGGCPLCGGARLPTHSDGSGPPYPAPAMPMVNLTASQRLPHQPPRLCLGCATLATTRMDKVARAAGARSWAAVDLCMLRACMHAARAAAGSPCWAGAGGLLRELSPGPLAPDARIMPLDQAASCGWTPAVRRRGAGLGGQRLFFAGTEDAQERPPSSGRRSVRHSADRVPPLPLRPAAASVSPSIPSLAPGARQVAAS